jgi:hypothetical protein
MHAVLMLAASHHRFLYRSTHSYRYYELECLHRSYALSGLRYTLDTTISQDNFDSLLACSFLLLFHSWSFLDTPNMDEIDFAVDGVLALTCGTRDLILQARKQRIHSIFGGVLTRSFDIPEQEVSFPVLQDLCYALYSEKTDNTYRSAAKSLVSTLSLIQKDTSHDVERYLVLWPALCSNEYIAAIRQNDEQALAILAHFYAAASALSSRCDWWFTNRSSFMYQAIVRRLGKSWEKYLMFKDGL